MPCLANKFTISKGPSEAIPTDTVPRSQAITRYTAAPRGAVLHEISVNRVFSAADCRNGRFCGFCIVGWRVKAKILCGEFRKSTHFLFFSCFGLISKSIKILTHLSCIESKQYLFQLVSYETGTYWKVGFCINRIRIGDGKQTNPMEDIFPS